MDPIICRLGKVGLRVLIYFKHKGKGGEVGAGSCRQVGKCIDSPLLVNRRRCVYGDRTRK